MVEDYRKVYARDRMGKGLSLGAERVLFGGGGRIC